MGARGPQPGSQSDIVRKAMIELAKRFTSTYQLAQALGVQVWHARVLVNRFNAAKQLETKTGAGKDGRRCKTYKLKDGVTIADTYRQSPEYLRRQQAEATKELQDAFRNIVAR